MDAIPPFSLDLPQVKIEVAQTYYRADQARDAILKPAFELFTLSEAPEAQLVTAEFVLEEVARAAVAHAETVNKRFESIQAYLQSIEVAAAVGENPGR